MRESGRITSSVGREPILRRITSHIKVALWVESTTETVLWSIIMGINMKEVSKMARSMETESIHGKMATTMTDNGKTTAPRATAPP